VLYSVRKKKINKSFYVTKSLFYVLFYVLKCDKTDDNFILFFELLIFLFYCFIRNL